MISLSFLILDSSFPINTRNKRIVQTLRAYYGDSAVNYVAWNRDERDIVDADEGMMVYSAKSAYGNLFSKLAHMVGYYSFLKECNSKKNPKVIIASHWDMLFLAALMKKKSQYLIYENLDIPTAASLGIRKILEQIERWALKRTDAIVFASRFFKPLYASFSGEKFVLENKPLQIFPSPSVAKNVENIIISYIGLVRYADILKNLIDAVRGRKNVFLYLHGEGQDLSELKKYAQDCNNIKFTGRYEGNELPRLYAGADLVWAAYPNKDYNVKYAISNKFHESIAYHVPCVYAKETLLGDFVSEKNIGYVVDPYNVSDINRIIDYVLEHRSDLLVKKQALKQYAGQEMGWNEQFQPIIEYLNLLK